MYIERDLEKKLKKYRSSREIIAVVGARQCGKTTLLHNFLSKFNNKEILTFEDQEVLEIFSNDIKQFVELYVDGRDYLFIDEFQYAKNGGKQLKYIYDTCKVKIFITGSSAPDLAVHGLKFLVGRVFVFNLYPLSFSEFLRYKDVKLHKLYLKKNNSKELLDMINKYYFEFLIYGGYPRVILSKSKEEKIRVLKNIYDTYFLREIKEILQLSDNFKLSKLIKVLALQVGGLTNYTEIMSSVDLSKNELLKYLDILKQTFICLEASPFFTNKKKEIIKMSEYFFLDNGFRNVVLKNFQEAINRSDIGSLNENFVASEIVKGDAELKFWRTKAKAEVDFVLEKDGKVLPIEVKSGLIAKRVSRSFRNFLESYSSSIGYLLSFSLVGKMNVGTSLIYFKGICEIGKVVQG